MHSAVMELPVDDSAVGLRYVNNHLVNDAAFRSDERALYSAWIVNDSRTNRRTEQWKKILGAVALAAIALIIVSLACIFYAAGAQQYLGALLASMFMAIGFGLLAGTLSAAEGREPSV